MKAVQQQLVKYVMQAFCKVKATELRLKMTNLTPTQHNKFTQGDAGKYWIGQMQFTGLSVVLEIH